MSHAIIDRRKNDKKKSSVNRRKFIEKVKEQLRDGVKDSIREGNIKDLISSDKKKVRIPIRNLDEPHFHHDGTGVNDIVRPGNDRFIPGDKIKRPQSGQGTGGGGSPDGEGEDAFVFHLTKDEFYELFFENCALPDMVKKTLAIINEEELRRTGITSDGPPSALNIERSMRNAKARRFALRALKLRQLHALEEDLQKVQLEIDNLSMRGGDVEDAFSRKEEIEKEIQLLRTRMAAIAFIDPMDLKFNHWSKVSIPTTQAVIFRVMDVSGSMTEEMKELSKTFFILLQLFLEKEYTHIEIVNIKYHSVATETTDHDFFYGTETGGTVTSNALALVDQLITEKYPTSLWNSYVAHASDGDNWSNDNEIVTDIMTGKLLSKLQYYAYVQINAHMSTMWRGHIHDPNNMWDLFEGLKAKYPNIDCALVEEMKDVYPVFVKLFEKKSSK
ncbi:MAG: YeaH/YhbH family protein [Candidatus Thorarchaeota archaeon]|nr:MAG: YeaH/YhbH family protein [Candidatus Thorarchaeota archaeon]